MATISLSSLFMVGQRVAKYWRATLAKPLMAVVEADYGRIASSTIRALSDVRPSAGLLLCLAFNILLITGGGVLCVSGYGFAVGLSVVVLALAPALMLLNIALFAWMEEGRRPSLLRVISTSAQASQRSETVDEKYPSIVPEKPEAALDEKTEPHGKSTEKRNREGTPTAEFTSVLPRSGRPAHSNDT